MGLLRIKLKMMTCLLAVLNSCKRLMLHDIYLHPILSSCCITALIEEAQHYIIALPFNEWREPIASYRRTGWVWEITSWSSRLQENYSSFLEESMEHTLHRWRKAERSQNNVTGWTWKHYDFHRSSQNYPRTLLTSNTHLSSIFISVQRPKT